jgi:hypothetical protein
VGVIARLRRCQVDTDDAWSVQWLAQPRVEQNGLPGLRFGCRIVDGDGVDTTIRKVLGFRCGSVVVCWWQITRRLADYCWIWGLSCDGRGVQLLNALRVMVPDWLG